MASKRRAHKTKLGLHSKVGLALIGVAACAAAAFVGIGVASAGVASSDDLTMGLGSAPFTSTFTVTGSSTTQASSTANAKSATETSTNATSGDALSSSAFVERAPLATSAASDIDVALEQLIARIEEEVRAAAEAARQAELRHIEEVEEEQAGSAVSGLELVDWSVGKTAFIEEWTQRIDDYLDGSPLAGYGYDFASAAWDNGIDPRWSPAISNTESTKGANCFASHNAWGWGSASWTNWTDAIWAHVSGLAEGYGYTISLGAAQTYCPPNYSNWYYNTLSQMKLI